MNFESNMALLDKKTDTDNILKIDIKEVDMEEEFL